MQMKWLVIAAALCAWPMGEACAETSATVQPAPFSESVVGDFELSTARAGYALPPLTIGRVAQLAEVQARGDFRDTAAIGRVTMDIWWGSTGAELIAANVRAATP